MMQGHGDFQVDRDGEIITLIAKGLWNEESSTTCIGLIADQIAKINSQNFAIVADTREVEGLTPGSEALWFEAIQDWFAKGHSAIARIDDPAAITYKVFLKGFDDYFQERIQFTYAQSMMSGINWARDKGFSGSFQDKEAAFD